MNTAYDAIVVGARCAGSPTAMLSPERDTGCSWWTARRSERHGVHACRHPLGPGPSRAGD